MQNAKDSNGIVVLVTGASGYLATHCIRQLLNAGYRVRGTVRDLTNRAKVDPIHALVTVGNESSLELIEADLNDSSCWLSAVRDCTYILHTASPVIIAADESIIRTAIDGTLNVLRAANECTDVRRVVMTSSTAAINEGNLHDDQYLYTESDWTNLDNPSHLSTYVRSKTMAEQAAWEFVNNIQSGNRFELTVINPSFLVGPVLIDDMASVSISVIRRFMLNELPLVPQLHIPFCDVRNAAHAHICAMTNDRANGQRFIVSAQPSLWFTEMAQMLQDHFGQFGYKISTRKAPNFLIHIYSLFDRQVRDIRNRLGIQATTILGIKFSDINKSLIDMVDSMITRGIVPQTVLYHK